MLTLKEANRWEAVLEEALLVGAAAGSEVDAYLGHISPSNLH